IARIQSANELAAEHRRQRDLHDELVTDIDNMEEQIQQLQESVSQLKKMHVRKVEEIKELDTPEDVEPLQSQLATVEETNAAIRANNVARDKKSHQNDLREQYSKYTKKIEALGKKKADGLAEARMPVPGLGFDDIGV